MEKNERAKGAWLYEMVSDYLVQTGNQLIDESECRALFKDFASWLTSGE